MIVFLKKNETTFQIITIVDIVCVGYKLTYISKLLPTLVT